MTKDSADSMNEGRQKLTGLFEEMNDFRKERSKLKNCCLCKRSAYAVKIAECQDAIKHALATFGVEANARMFASQEQILKKLDDMSRLENTAAAPVLVPVADRTPPPAINRPPAPAMEISDPLPPLRPPGGISAPKEVSRIGPRPGDPTPP
ncbi:hypothetical protein B0H10DRAFT_2190894, partial [Mycena sp. CBHHK59/15]